MPYRPLAIALLLLPLTVPAADDEENSRTGTLHISRPKYFINGGIKPGIVIDGEEYPVLPNGACMTIDLPPGAHTIALKLSNRYTSMEPRSFNVDAGGKAYARVSTLIDKVDDDMFHRLFTIDIAETPTPGNEIACTRQIDPKSGKRHRKSAWTDN